MIDAHMSQAFARDGMLIIPDFLNKQECHELQAAIGEHFKPLVTGSEAAVHQSTDGAFMRAFECDVIPWDPVAEGVEIFQQIRAKETLAALTRSCIGNDYSENSSLVMYSCTGGRGQSWHQDCLPDQQLGFNVNRLLYCQDVEQEDGAVVVVPGSHKSGRIPAGSHHGNMDGQRVLCPRAGMLVLLHGWCFHRVLPNFSAKERVSINYRCYPHGVDPSVTGVGVYRNGDAYFRRGLAKWN